MQNGITSSNGISKKDAGQLGQSVAWFSGRYPASSYIPIIIHPERTLGQAASAVMGMCVIDTVGLEKLRKNLRSFSKEMAIPDISNNTTEVAKRLAQYGLNAEAFVNAFSVAVKA